MKKWKYGVLFIVLIQFCTPQKETSIPDLTKIGDYEGWKIFNREATIINEDDRVFVSFDARPNEGTAWIEGFEFTNGKIEADIRGKNVQGRSFIGIAFRGVDAQTYDVVYFRPFNFKSPDSLRKGHSVQYISHPDYPWHRLRKEFPEKYENPVNPVPDPDSFFHVTLIINKPTVSVYVNDAKEPCLVVEEITERSGGWVGLWMGKTSDGSFANLKISPN